MDVKEAVIAFLQARNAFTRTLQEVVDNGSEVVFRHKDFDHVVIISETLSVVSSEGKTTVACLNTEENVSFLVAHWEEFLQPGLSVLFMNPFVQQQWKVVPLIHDRVADKKTLREGLMSLFSQVPAC
ncbi:MAG: hypothetical protein ACMXYD_04335 [Candidatus Woesearchaeota archaeon]